MNVNFTRPSLCVSTGRLHFLSFPVFSCITPATDNHAPTQTPTGQSDQTSTATEQLGQVISIKTLLEQSSPYTTT